VVKKLCGVFGHLSRGISVSQSRCATPLRRSVGCAAILHTELVQANTMLQAHKENMQKQVQVN